jgi:hypothetical protein
MLARIRLRRFGQSFAPSLAEHTESAEKGKAASSSGKHRCFIVFAFSVFSLRSPRTLRETLYEKNPLRHSDAKSIDRATLTCSTAPIQIERVFKLMKPRMMPARMEAKASCTGFWK